jgi:hypothetical protein
MLASNPFSLDLLLGIFTQNRLLVDYWLHLRSGLTSKDWDNSRLHSLHELIVRTICIWLRADAQNVSVALRCGRQITTSLLCGIRQALLILPYIYTDRLRIFLPSYVEGRRGGVVTPKRIRL